jgi:hypothetical protein
MNSNKEEYAKKTKKRLVSREKAEKKIHSNKEGEEWGQRKCQKW